MTKMVNAMSVDVEEYFQVSAFEKYIARDSWETLPRRLDININKILTLFSQHNVKGTFFILGWIAERYPETIRRIADTGHEIASHGYSHIRVTNQSPDQFRQDITKTKIILEDLCAVPVNGYRAASYSINEVNHWAHDELERAGYKYSSSIYPIKHDLYGIPDGPRFSYRVKSSNLLEIPVSTVEWFGRRIPCGGGGYFRLYPYMFSRFLINKLNTMESKPCVFYFHPWEFDSDQPRQSDLDLRTRTRHYLNISKMEARISKLMSDFSWGRVDSIFLS